MIQHSDQLLIVLVFKVMSHCVLILHVHVIIQRVFLEVFLPSDLIQRVCLTRLYIQVKNLVQAIRVVKEGGVEVFGRTFPGRFGAREFLHHDRVI